MSSAVATNEISAAKERVEELRREVARIYLGSPRALDMMMVALLGLPAEPVSSAAEPVPSAAEPVSSHGYDPR